MHSGGVRDKRDEGARVCTPYTAIAMRAMRTASSSKGVRDKRGEGACVCVCVCVPHRQPLPCAPCALPPLVRE
eukprot:248413-Prorocentrum_minimum.AAC.1